MKMIVLLNRGVAHGNESENSKSDIVSGSMPLKIILPILPFT